MLRLLPSGELDPSFNGSGIVLLDFNASDGAQDIALQPDGKIVAAGGEGFADNVAIVRLLPDGSPDPSFSGDGKRTIDLGGQEYANGVALQSDGKIVLAGTTEAGGDKDMFVHRLDANGASDPGFGVAGTRVVDFAGLEDTGEDVVVQADGKIVAVGRATFGTERRFAAVRLLGDPLPSSPQPPADTAVGIRILGKKVRVDRRGFARLRLRCPATEATPPCHGRLGLRTRAKLAIGKGKRARKRPVVLGKRGFRVGAGRTRLVKVHLGKGKRRLLRSKRRARKVVAIARVRDGAGNRTVLSKKMRAVQQKRRKSR